VQYYLLKEENIYDVLKSQHTEKNVSYNRHKEKKTRHTLVATCNNSNHKYPVFNIFLIFKIILQILRTKIIFSCLEYCKNCFVATPDVHYGH